METENALGGESTLAKTVAVLRRATTLLKELRNHMECAGGGGMEGVSRMVNNYTCYRMPHERHPPNSRRPAAGRPDRAGDPPPGRISRALRPRSGRARGGRRPRA